MAFCHKSTKKDFIVTKEDEEDHRNIHSRLCEKRLNLIKLEINVT